MPIRNLARTVALVAGIWLGAGASSAIAQQWLGPTVAFVEEEETGCQLLIRGNGIYYKISAAGLAPGEEARFYVTNQDMRPIDRKVRANQGGGWAEFYVPFLAKYHAGSVEVTISSATCHVRTGFDWRRPSSSIDERAQATLSMPRSPSLR
jgi:hypothetical protein